MCIVVILFLQSWRTALIPLLAIPVSIIGTCAVLGVFGFSLNNLSMFGLVLSIGIVIDDAAIVVVEERGAITACANEHASKRQAHPVPWTR